MRRSKLFLAKAYDLRDLANTYSWCYNPIEDIFTRIQVHRATFKISTFEHFSFKSALGGLWGLKNRPQLTFGSIECDLRIGWPPRLFWREGMVLRMSANTYIGCYKFLNIFSGNSKSSHHLPLDPLLKQFWCKTDLPPEKWSMWYFRSREMFCRHHEAF